jgi:hypothetical protein
MTAPCAPHCVLARCYHHTQPSKQTALMMSNTNPMRSLGLCVCVHVCPRSASLLNPWCTAGRFFKLRPDYDPDAEQEENLAAMSAQQILYRCVAARGVDVCRLLALIAVGPSPACQLL